MKTGNEVWIRIQDRQIEKLSRDRKLQKIKTDGTLLEQELTSKALKRRFLRENECKHLSGKTVEHKFESLLGWVLQCGHCGSLNFRGNKWPSYEEHHAEVRKGISRFSKDGEELEKLGLI